MKKTRRRFRWRGAPFLIARAMMKWYSDKKTMEQDHEAAL